MEPRHLAQPDTDEEGQDRLLLLRQFAREQRRLAIMLVLGIIALPLLVLGVAMAIGSSGNQSHYDRGYNDGIALSRDIAPKPPQQVTVIATGGCKTTDLKFTIRIGGLTPLGTYTTDISPSPGGNNLTVDSVFKIDHADNIGTGEFYFNCRDSDKKVVPPGTYTVTITDNQTKMSGLVHLTVEPKG